LLPLKLKPLPVVAKNEANYRLGKSGFSIFCQHFRKQQKNPPVLKFWKWNTWSGENGGCLQGGDCETQLSWKILIFA